MPLSQQLRQARRLLAWTLDETSEKAGLPATVIAQAEIGDGAPDMTLSQLSRVKDAFETAGILFGYDGTVVHRRVEADPGE